MKQILLQWFKTRKQCVELELSQSGQMPVTIRAWIHHPSLPLATLVLLNPTSPPSLSGIDWRFLQLTSLRFPAAAQGRAKAGALASVLMFILRVSHLLFWLVLEARDCGLSCIVASATKPFWFALVVVFFFSWGVLFQRYSGLSTVWKTFSFNMWMEGGKFHLSWGLAVDH